MPILLFQVMSLPTYRKTLFQYIIFKYTIFFIVYIILEYFTLLWSGVKVADVTDLNNYTGYRHLA
jgi:hypothetical protein